MEKKKRKSLREQFEENYTAVPIPADNAQGYRMEYIYYAPWHLWDLPEDQLLHQKWILLYLSIGGFFLNLLAMIQYSPLNHMTPGILFCALILCCHVMEFKGLIQLIMARYRTTRMTFRDVDRALTFIPLVRCLLGFIFAGYCTWYGITQGGDSAWLLTAGYALAGLTGGILYNLYDKIPTRVEENDTLHQYEQENSEEEL